jgi:hypothetical protein
MKNVILFLSLCLSFIFTDCLAMDELDPIDVEEEGVPMPLVIKIPEEPIDVEADGLPTPSLKRKRSEEALPPAQCPKRQRAYVMPHDGDLLVKDEEKDPSATQFLLDTRGETSYFIKTSDRPNASQTNVDQSPEPSATAKYSSLREELTDDEDRTEEYFTDDEKPTQEYFTDTEGTEESTQEELLVVAIANNVGQGSAPQDDPVSQPSENTPVLQPAQNKTVSKKPTLYHCSRSKNIPPKDGV